MQNIGASYKDALSDQHLAFAQDLVSEAELIDECVEQVLVDAISSVPRELFVSPEFSSKIWDDCSLSIGYGREMLRPSLLVRMLGVLGLRKGMRILEVGCGCGYASAVMARAGAEVFALESVGLLAQRTRKLLDSLKYQSILVKRGDGLRGWAEHAPYSSIVVFDLYESIPAELLVQLDKNSGKMIGLVGTKERQVLTLWVSKAAGISIYELEEGCFL